MLNIPLFKSPTSQTQTLAPQNDPALGNVPMQYGSSLPIISDGVAKIAQMLAQNGGNGDPSTNLMQQNDPSTNAQWANFLSNYGQSGNGGSYG
jgi:hypothetical protein